MHAFTNFYLFFQSNNNSLSTCFFLAKKNLFRLFFCSFQWMSSMAKCFKSPKWVDFTWQRTYAWQATESHHRSQKEFYCAFNVRAHTYIYITCISDGNINHKCFAIEFLSTSNMLFYSYLYLTFIHIFFALVPFAFIIGVCECVLCFVCRVFESFHKFLSIIQMPGYFTCAICKARFFCTLSLLFVVSFQIHEKFTICCMHACSLTRLPYDVSHHIETISDVSAAHIHS